MSQTAAPTPKPASAHPPRPAPNPETRGRVGWWTLFALSFLIAGAVALYYFKYHQTASGAPPHHAPPTIPVHVFTVTPTTVPVELSYLGQTESSKSVEVRARVAAYLQKRLFEEGYAVTEGQTLFLLERTNLESQLSLENAALLQAQARNEQARKQVERYKSLISKDVVTLKELEDWETTLAVSAADILAARARIQKAELDLSYTIVKAPITGIAGKAMKDVGSYLDTMNPAADSLLAVIRKVDPIYVQFPVSERDLIQNQLLADAGTMFKNKALKIRVRLADGSIYSQLGTIDFVDSYVDPATGTALIRATLANSDLLLRPGQFVRAEVLGLERKNVLAVPQSAVLQTPKGAIVMLANAHNQAEPRPVVLGEWTTSYWIVNSGLNPGDRVILDHLVMLPPGSPIAVLPESHPTSTPAPAPTSAPASPPASLPAK